MDAMASQITSRAIVYSTVYSGADQSKHQSSVSLAFVRGIHRRPVNSPHKWPVTRKMFLFDDVIMKTRTDRWYNLVRTITSLPYADSETQVRFEILKFLVSSWVWFGWHFVLDSIIML